jgi:5-methylcytosine-specific restriction endonuclease McrA
MSVKRKPISKLQRFEIFKRDNFTCHYCGNHPPHVILEVDHIIAVSKGGTNNEDNLITACFNCNRGKAARDLNCAPKGMAEKAKLIAEQEEQLAGYQKIIMSRVKRLEAETWEIIRPFSYKNSEGVDTVSRDWFRSVSNFIERLGFADVYQAMEIALAKNIRRESDSFKYFCGICWKKVKEQGEP